MLTKFDIRMSNTNITNKNQGKLKIKKPKA